MKKLIRYLVNWFGFDITRKVKIDFPEPNFSIGVYDNFPEESLVKRRFYNIGAGSFKHPYWINIDHLTEHYRDIQKNPFFQYDLMELKPLPVEDNVAELVYSSHTIEHVSDEAVRNMLSESYRILKPGGGIRLTTPDAFLEFQAYRRKDIKWWYWVDWYSRPGTFENI